MSYIVIFLSSLFVVGFYINARVSFLLAPILLNFYRKEKFQFHGKWDKGKLVGVICMFSFSILFLLISYNEVISLNYFFSFLSSIVFFSLVVAIENIMEHKWSPVLSFKKFLTEKYVVRFRFTEEKKLTDTLEDNNREIQKSISQCNIGISAQLVEHGRTLLTANNANFDLLKNISKISFRMLRDIEFLKQNNNLIRADISKANQKISKGFHQQEQNLSETNELTKLNNKILQDSDFTFEIKNSGNLPIPDIMVHYSISNDSEKVLSDFLLRKKKSGKILFTKLETKGKSIQTILNFFSAHTDLMESCRSGAMKQIEVIKIINTIASSKMKREKICDDPITAQNFSKYFNR